MGKQHNKVIKRRRRKAYLERKKARDKAGIGRLPSTRAKGATSAEGDAKAPAKKAAKKAAVKKVAKKKEETAAVETTEAVVETPVVETPATEAAPAAE